MDLMGPTEGVDRLEACPTKRGSHRIPWGSRPRLFLGGPRREARVATRARLLVAPLLCAVGAVALAAAPPPPTVHVDAAGVSAVAPASAAGKSLCRYVFDWGDGTQGTGSPVNPGVPGHAGHRWARSGTYQVRARLVTSGGQVSGWSAPAAYDVTAAREAGPPPERLGSLTVTASSSAPGSSAGGLLAGRGWSSALRSTADRHEWVTIDLGRPRTVNEIALDPLAKGEGFPEAFAVEYCTDGGRAWYRIPRYEFSRYPNPGGETVLLETGLLVARQIRIVATRLAPVTSPEPGGYAFGLRGVALYCGRQAPFYTSLGGAFDADVNNLWNIYGLASNELTPKGDAWWDGLGGALAFGSTEWHEWDVLKLCWADLPRDLRRLRADIRDVPMDPDGYVWACAAGPLHLNAQKHFDYNAINILAAYKYYLWTGERGFFTDPLPAAVRKRCPPGVKTMLDKLRAEMAYQLDVLHGKEGLLKITEPGYDGTPGSKGTTYWDAYPMGYLSSYPNALFYASVAAMANIEGIAGSQAQRARYLRLLPLIKRKFNATFWSPAKGRYIATVDARGVRHDYGITSANLYAVVYGVADADKARRMMGWLTGKRLVPGDTSRGAGIYHWQIAPRSNTVAFESIKPHWWAGDFAKCYLTPTGWGRWGVNLQNGGAIFYVSYYDLLARLRTIGADNAFARFSTIVSEFHRDDELRPSRLGNYGPAGTPYFAVGVSTCFPESGLVPLAMLYGFLGVSPTPDGLRVHPSLPSKLQYAGVRDVLYHGAHYDLRVDRAASKMTMDETAKGHFAVTVPATGTSLIRAPARQP